MITYGSIEDDAASAATTPPPGAMYASELAQPTAQSPSMLVSLDQRRRDAIRRCTDAARSAGTQLLFGMTTSLALQSAPIPDGCDLDPTLLHTVSSDRTKRVRSGATVTHLWRALPQNGNVRVNRNVYALDLFHTWAQLADHLPLESLIVLGDAIITATARQRALARGRDAAGVHRDLLAFAETLPRFKGKRACLSSIQLIRPGADSPPESRERLSLLRHGLPDMALNHTVPDVAFRSGAAMTLDMAWPQWRVAVEYDGDQHRTDKAQWRRDTEKRDLLRGRDWVIFVATGATLADAGARAEFAFRVARVLTMRGAEFMFRVAEAPIETVIREVRRRG